jgi:hypothetical protein
MTERPRLAVAKRAPLLWTPAQARLVPLSAELESIARQLLPPAGFAAVGGGHRPLPGDNLLRVAPTAADLNLPEPTLDDAVELLSDVPFWPAMRVLSQLTAAVHHSHHDPERHRELARAFYRAPVLEAVERFLDENAAHLVFDERQLEALGRLAIQHCRDDDPEHGLGEADLRALNGALLALASALPHGEPPEPAPGTEPDWEAWTRYTVQAGLWYDQSYVAEAMARAWSWYATVAPQLAGHPDNCDFDQWMRAEYEGTGVVEQLSAGLAFAVGSGALDPLLSVEERAKRVPGPGYLANCDLAPLEAQLVRALSADRAELRELLAELDADPMRIAWDRAPLEAKPFVRQPDGHLLVRSPSAITAWLTRGIHFRVLDAAKRHGAQRGRRPAWKQWLDFAGALGERSVLDTVKASLAPAEEAGALRVVGEQEYHVGGERHDGPDTVVAMEPDLVLIEVFSGRLSREARIGTDPQPLIDGLKRAVVGKLAEVLDRAGDVLAGHLVYGDRKAVRQIYPVLLMSADGITVTPFLWGWLRQELAAVDPTDARIRRPVIIDLDELEPLLALCERGRTLSELLGQYLDSGYAELPLRNWLHDEIRPDFAVRPTYISEHYTLAMQAARLRMFPKSSSAPAAE